MKFLSLCTATALLLATLGSTQAQSLIKDAVLSGKLYTQATNVVMIEAAQTEGRMVTPIVTTPLSLRALLDVFGYPDVSAKSVGLFLDEYSITVAKKDGSFIYGTLVALAGSGATGEEDSNQAFYASSAALLSDALTGEGLVAFKKAGKNRVAVKFGFTGHGTTSEAAIVIKGTVSFTDAVPR